jgi:hypothetical protein
MIKTILLIICLTFTLTDKARANLRVSPIQCKVVAYHPEGGFYWAVRESCKQAWWSVLVSCFKENKEKYSRCQLYSQEIVLWWY